MIFPWVGEPEPGGGGGIWRFSTRQRPPTRPPVLSPSIGYGLRVERTGSSINGEVTKSTRMMPFKPSTNITIVARKVELDTVMHLALEFALRTHHITKISSSAHWFRRIPQFRLGCSTKSYRSGTRCLHT
jgi:hypothetical protein